MGIGINSGRNRRTHNGFCQRFCFQKDTEFSKESFKEVFKVVIVLIITDIISNIVFNGDRLVLKIFIDGTAVTVYYIASLLGKTVSLISTPLNSVIIGYLAKYKGNLNLKFMNLVTVFSLAAVVIGTPVLYDCLTYSDIHFISTELS